MTKSLADYLYQQWLGQNGVVTGSTVNTIALYESGHMTGNPKK